MEVQRVVRDGDEASELVERHGQLPRVSYADVRQEADEFFGGADRIGVEDPWERASR
ncbi:hypothetical protein [Allokutzneria sp. NRRL B-24872]|uniref:hypothetical protein n=1 Tax=Allokutzneria sp. NRRL B-24872 TaxID=1137961 RepID=UPI001FF02C86|nr:hypothetical protein [Allokutzneria sp. NRRL B-24872]